MRGQLIRVATFAAAFAAILACSGAQAQLARADVAGNRTLAAFEPETISIGAFKVSPSATAIASYDDNIFNFDVVKRSDRFLVLVPRINAEAEFNRVNLRVSANGRFTRSDRFTQNDVNEYALVFAPQIRIDEGNTISFTGAERRVAENRAGLGLGLLGFGRETYREPSLEVLTAMQGSQIKLTASFAWANRRYTSLVVPDADRLKQLLGDDPNLLPLIDELAVMLNDLAGERIDQSFRDTRSTTISSAVEYRPQGVVSPYLAVTLSRVRSPAPKLEGEECCLRNSNGFAMLAGVRSDAAGLFAFDLAAGKRSRRFRNPAFADFSGFTYRANIQWFLRRYLTIQYRAAQDERNSGIANVAGVRVNSGTANLIYEPGRRTTLTFERLAERERFREIGLTTKLRAYAVRAKRILGTGLSLDAEFALRRRNAAFDGQTSGSEDAAAAALLKLRNFAMSIGVTRRW